MADCTVKRIDDMEAVFGGGFVRARAELGVESFGMQVLRFPPNSGDRYPEHDHTHDGQEEVFVVMQGDGELEVDGERHPLDADMMVRVGPAARRSLRSGPNGMRVLALSGVPGKPYTPSPNSLKGAGEPTPPPSAK